MKLRTRVGLLALVCLHPGCRGAPWRSPADEVDRAGSLAGRADPSPAWARPEDGLSRDLDREGAVASEDQCVDTRETPNGYADWDGCPDGLPPEMAPPPSRDIYFDHLEVTIRPESRPALAHAAEFLRRVPVNVVVKCHESREPGPKGALYGPAVQKFTLRRARAVKKHLVDLGVEPGRVKTRGAGWDEPVDTNDTEAGRARNRRCSFEIGFVKGGLFGPGSDSIHKWVREELVRLVAILKEHVSTRVEVRCHEPRYAGSGLDDLARRRSAAIRTFLTEHGVGPGRIDVWSAGRGERRRAGAANGSDCDILILTH